MGLGRKTRQWGEALPGPTGGPQRFVLATEWGQAGLAPWLDAKRGLDLRRVKADDNSSIDYGNRSCHVSEPPKLVDSPGILGNVPFLKANPFLRKILFRPFTKHSTRLREHRNSCLLHSPRSS